MIDKPFTTALCKYEVAEKLGISMGTLSNLLNIKYINELEEIGYNKKSKKLLPNILNYLKNKIDLQNE